MIALVRAADQAVTAIERADDLGARSKQGDDAARLQEDLRTRVRILAQLAWTRDGVSPATPAPLFLPRNALDSPSVMPVPAVHSQASQELVAS